MSGSGGKGGGSQQTVEIPEFLERGLERNLGRAEDLASVGHIVDYGPAVAALDPMQKAMMQSTYDGAAAFGLAPVGGDALAGLPEEQVFAGGIRGYSTAPTFEAARAEFEAKNPMQAETLAQHFVPYGTPETNPNYDSSMPYGPGNIPPYGTPEFAEYVRRMSGGQFPV
ncbi:MAG: hypothetical protein Unbinned8622contig1005_33 [Prokaryotic dsDNA virus sp.]|nr:MAG: hypothetical protein Unbinned8622contig1005_33 [Prokaryotic dsDNA virus sp.]|tara:strand:+ start:21212 stop:21718 length:507 start_codon:yes stop_codon:yes gene_type:complete